jgi:hypothetical protein
MYGAAVAALPFRFPALFNSARAFILAGDGLRFAAGQQHRFGGFCLPPEPRLAHRRTGPRAQISLWTAPAAGRHQTPEFLKEKLCRLFR